MINEWLDMTTRYEKGKIFIRNIHEDQKSANISGLIIREFLIFVNNYNYLSGGRTGEAAYEQVIEQFICTQLIGPIGTSCPEIENWPNILESQYLVNISLIDLNIFELLFRHDHVNKEGLPDVSVWLQKLHVKGLMLESRRLGATIRGGKALAWLSVPKELSFSEDFSGLELKTDELRARLGIPVWAEDACPCAFFIPVSAVAELLRKPSVFEAGMNYVFRSNEQSQYVGKTVDLLDLSQGVTEVVTPPLDLELVEQIVPLEKTQKSDAVDWSTLSADFSHDFIPKILANFDGDLQ